MLNKARGRRNPTTNHQSPITNSPSPPILCCCTRWLRVVRRARGGGKGRKLDVTFRSRHDNIKRRFLVPQPYPIASACFLLSPKTAPPPLKCSFLPPFSVLPPTLSFYSSLHYALSLFLSYYIIINYSPSYVTNQTFLIFILIFLK